MLKKILSISFVVIFFILGLIFLVPKDNEYKVIEVNSPGDFVLDSGINIKFNDYTTFDSWFTERNKSIAANLSISEEEAFILGNLGKYWAENLMKGRKVVAQDGDLIYYKYSYKTKFLYSGFCLFNSKPYNQEAFNKRLNAVRKGSYQVLDLDTDICYKPTDSKVREL